jgi:uncharacterized iron-regulated protein
MLTPAPLLATSPPSPEFQEWQVIEVTTGRPISFDQLLSEIAPAAAIYIGEEHRNRSHIEAALKILRALLKLDRRPVLAVEMFGWDGQAGLDRYLLDPLIPRELFLKESRWTQNWGGLFDDYEPLIGFARAERLPVLALNPPTPLVRRVSKEGLAQARGDPEMNRWGMQSETIEEDPRYRNVIISQLRSCHGGLPDDAYQRMYEASMFRDEGMAKTISDTLRRLPPAAGPVVSYTGSGHIQYGLPVPHRVQRRRGQPILHPTIYLTPLIPGQEEEIRELMRHSIADYLLLTPISAHGPVPRCR